MAEDEPQGVDGLDEDEVADQHAEELPDREVMSVLAPMNPAAPVGGDVIQPPPPDS
jgi:hypothetical protein